jgi:hypothetical protein
LFKMMIGINMVHVPYRGGGPALTESCQIRTTGLAPEKRHRNAAIMPAPGGRPRLNVLTANLTGFDPSRTSAVTQPDMPEATRVRLPKR